MNFDNFKAERLVLLASLLFLIWCYNCLNFISIKNRYISIDLVNRIQGSNLLQSNKSLYYYKWNESENYKYLDPFDFPKKHVNRNVYTPFYLYVFSIFTSIPLKSANIIWCYVQIISLLSLWFIVVHNFLPGTNSKIIYTIIIFFLIGCSSYYNLHILNGQTYLLYPLIVMSIYYLDFKEKKWGVGIAMTILILLRPIFILILLIFLIRKKYTSIIVFFTLLFIYVIFQIFTGNITHWIEYLQMLKSYSIDFFIYDELTYAKLLKIESFFGLKLYNKEHFNFIGNALSEQTAIKYFVRNLFGFPIPNFVYPCLFFLIILFLVYYLRNKIINYDQSDYYLLFSLVYYLLEVFQPVYRHSYYQVQILLPISFFFMKIDNLNNLLKSALLVSLILMFGISSNKYVIEQTLGELLIYIVIIFYLYNKSNSLIINELN